MPIKLCCICHQRPAHPQYGNKCEDCYADTQSYLTRPFDSCDLYGSKPRAEDAFGERALDAPISILGLSAKIENRLFDCNIRLVKDLVKKTKEELIEIRTFGEATVIEIKEKLQGIGLALQENNCKKVNKNNAWRATLRRAFLFQII